MWHYSAFALRTLPFYVQLLRDLHQSIQRENELLVLYILCLCKYAKVTKQKTPYIFNSIPSRSLHSSTWTVFVSTSFPSSNCLAIGHFVLICQESKVWATRISLSPNVHYCPLQDSYAYVTFNKCATPRKSQTCGFRCPV